MPQFIYSVEIERSWVFANTERKRFRELESGDISPILEQAALGLLLMAGAGGVLGGSAGPGTHGKGHGLTQYAAEAFEKIPNGIGRFGAATTPSLNIQEPETNDYAFNTPIKSNEVIAAYTASGKALAANIDFENSQKVQTQQLLYRNKFLYYVISPQEPEDVFENGISKGVVIKSKEDAMNYALLSQQEEPELFELSPAEITILDVKERQAEQLQKTVPVKIIPEEYKDEEEQDIKYERKAKAELTIEDINEMMDKISQSFAEPAKIETIDDIIENPVKRFTPQAQSPRTPAADKSKPDKPSPTTEIKPDKKI